MRRNLYVAAVLLLIVVTSWGAVSYLTAVRNVSSLAWMPDGYIYFLGTERASTEYLLWRTKEGEHEPKHIVLSDTAGCYGPTLRMLHPLLDGRLGVVLGCGDGRSAIAAYDTQAKESTPLLISDWQFHYAVLDEDLQKGYVAFHYNDCFGIGEFSVPAGVREFLVAPSIGGRRWHLDGSLFLGGCFKLGLSGWPNIRPGYDGFIFLASSEEAPIKNKKNPSPSMRWEGSWAMYTWDGTSTSVRKIYGPFRSPTGLTVSPDGKHALVSAKKGGENDETLWRVDLASGLAVELASGDFIDPSYSPDGKRLAIADGDDIRVIDI